MSKKVAIIGCGQMGSRHLQAVACLDDVTAIEIVEPYAASREAALKRLHEVLPVDSKIKVEWYDNLAALGHQADLTIIASNAPGRAEMITALAQKGHNRFLVEKLVCQSQGEYDSIVSALKNNSIKAWVNCTRPYFTFYEKIIQLLNNEELIQFRAMAGNFGLGCNAIHLLALFQALVGYDKELKLSDSHFWNSLLPNKRGNDLVEFAGTVHATAGGHSVASVDFHPLNDAPVVINIVSDNWRICVEEGKNKAFLASKESGWEWQSSELGIAQTSILTGRITRDIFDNDTCSLPTVQGMYGLHVELFNVFNEHIQRVTGTRPEMCPIT